LAWAITISSRRNGDWEQAWNLRSTTPVSKSTIWTSVTGLPISTEAQRAAEEAARRAAEEKARQEENARRQVEAATLDAAKRQIQQPVDNFPLSHADLTDVQKQRLDEKIVLLKQYPNLRFHIYGHTCETGSREVNERIGLERATQAKAYMISKGIAESRILGTASKRDTEPLVPNTNEESRRQNRRVQLVIQ